MIAMQYSFTLPEDYDMAIIRRRIESKGSLMNGFPDLEFKAFQYAERGHSSYTSDDNLYAPFYLWNGNEGMNRFIESEGFVSLTQSFGWPSIRLWSVWQARLQGPLKEARFATRETASIAPHASIAEEKARAMAGAANISSYAGCLAVVVAFDPGAWTLVRYALWAETPHTDRIGAPFTERQTYEVGHVAEGAGITRT